MKKKRFIFALCTFFALCLLFTGIQLVQSHAKEQEMDESNIFRTLSKDDVQTITRMETGCMEEEENCSVFGEKDKKNIIAILRTIKAEKSEEELQDIYGGRTQLILTYMDGRTDSIEFTGSLIEPDIIYNNTIYKIQPDSMDTCLAFRESYLRHPSDH